MNKNKSAIVRRILVICLAFGMLSFSGCSAQEDSEELQTRAENWTVFPLEEDTITEALEQIGLPWVISESDTQSWTEDQIVYMLRDPEKTYVAGEEDPSGKVAYASIVSAITEGERVLNVTFLQDAIPWRELPAVHDELVPVKEEMPDFTWEDWKPQIELAALLYGGFESEEELYQAFAEQEIPESKDPLQWEAEFPGAYCRIVRSSFQSHTSSIPESYDVRVMIYESKELYEKMLEESKKNYEKAQEEKKKILEEKEKQFWEK